MQLQCVKCCTHPNIAITFSNLANVIFHCDGSRLSQFASLYYLQAQLTDMPQVDLGPLDMPAALIQAFGCWPMAPVRAAAKGLSALLHGHFASSDYPTTLAAFKVAAALNDAALMSQARDRVRAFVRAIRADVALTRAALKPASVLADKKRAGEVAELRRSNQQLVRELDKALPSAVRKGEEERRT